MKRKLNDKQVSGITLKNGAYLVRAGYFVQKAVDNQVSNHAAELELTIADQARSGLLVAAALLTTLSALF